MLALCFAALVFTLASWVVGKVVLAAIDRLGVDPMGMLLWLGLAEPPIEQPRKERRRLKELLAEPPPSSVAG